MRNLDDLGSAISKKNVSIYYVLGALILSCVTLIANIVYTYYYTGEFVFIVDPIVQTSPSIEIADNAIFESSTTRLHAHAAVDPLTMTYNAIKIDDILLSEGQYLDIDHAYLAYSFYIKNNGNETISVDYYMRLVDTFYWMEAYVRILVIEDDHTYRMYQKLDGLDIDDNMPTYSDLPMGIAFESTTRVFSDRFDNFKAGDVKLFRVIMWLESQDPNMNQHPSKGHLITQLIFSANHQDLAHSTQSYSLSSNDKNLWFSLSSLCSVELGMYYSEEDNES